MLSFSICAAKAASLRSETSRHDFAASLKRSLNPSSSRLRSVFVAVELVARDREVFEGTQRQKGHRMAVQVGRDDADSRRPLRIGVVSKRKPVAWRTWAMQCAPALVLVQQLGLGHARLVLKREQQRSPAEPRRYSAQAHRPCGSW